MVGTIWVTINAFSQLFSSYYAYLRKDVYHTTKFCLHSTYWLVKSWEEFVLSVLIDREGAVSGRERMVGDWFFLATAIVLCLMSLNMDVLEVAHNLLFLLLTVSTISQIPLGGYYIFFGVICSLFTALSLYGTFARLINSIGEKTLIPVGVQPLSTEKLQDVLGLIKRCWATQEKADKTPPPPPCSIATSRKTSGLLSISKLLDASGVCGIPTDTVYALAASCKHPQAIEKIYNIKDRPQEKPICICISNLEQLSTAKPPFSPLLWEFMRNVYPGGISCIVKKGEWLNRLGVGPAYDRVGTKESIMIRVPDHTVTAHLCNITGPLAITSANPSGEPDSTHHDMVITRLGHKISGVLCDGESNEAVGSTVVNCLKIDEGTITIIREGCFPAAQVRHIFEKVKNSME
ncbi:UNVERIFIED_CONTAM: hypothetical protein FKN15_005888 [Acipenser sinensis]